MLSLNSMGYYTLENNKTHRYLKYNLAHLDNI